MHVAVHENNNDVHIGIDHCYIFDHKNAQEDQWQATHTM